MVRRAQVLPLLAATTILALGAPAGAHPGAPRPASAPHHAVTLATAARAEDDLPLQVTIASLSPSVVPDRGKLRISGTVSNVGDETYDDIRVYGLTSTVPITTRAELADAVESDPAIEVGDRITSVLDALDSLDPGETASYTLKIPHDQMPIGATSQPGVYWFGVHALGATAAGRDQVADGKARTFLPLAPSDHAPIDTALVMSVRHSVEYRPDGSLRGVRGWRTDLAPGGALQELVGFARAAGTRPLTWLVDPAVPDAIARLADANPARDLGRTPAGGGNGGEPTAAPAGGGEEDGTEDSAKRAELLDGAAQGADAWLAGARGALAGDQILTLPYGDVDVSAAARWSPTVYQTARQRAGREVPRLGLAATPAVAAPDGYLDPTAIGILPAKTTVLVTDQMFTGTPASAGVPTVARTAGHEVLVADEATTTGGPGPGLPTTPLQMRQRILSESALRLIGDEGPLVVRLPADWAIGTPVESEEFFTGLAVPWLHLTNLAGIADHKAVPVDAADLRYPDDEASAELASANFTAARDLMDTGRLIESMLPVNHTVAGEVRDEALTTTSYASRERPDAARVAAGRSRGVLATQMGKVTVEAPSSVTLSSESGPFTANVTNGLDQRVRVQLVARTDAKLEIAPSKVVELAPGELATVEMTARSSVLGIHDVDLVVANADGEPVGDQATFPLRAAQVSNVIWVVFGVGGVLLFGAIAVRLYRRIRGFFARRGATA